MSDVFPKWTNKLPIRVIVGLILLGGATVVGLTYYATPKYTRVGYQPVQPVAFSHAIHADQLGLDQADLHGWHAKKPRVGRVGNPPACI